MNLYISRHGESKGNVCGNAGPDPELTERGFAQAKALGERLSKIKLDLILASPTKRALATANEVAKRQKEGGSKVFWLAELAEVERDNKKEQKLSDKKDLLEAFPNASPFSEIGPLGYTDTILPDADGGVGRGYAALNFLLERFLDKDMNILVVAHGIFNSRFISAAIGGEYPFFCRHISDNAMLSLVSYSEDTDEKKSPILVFHNDISHLIALGVNDDRL